MAYIAAGRPLRLHALPPDRPLGLDLPLLSLGYWHNFGDDKPFETQRAISRRAFDLGITHHDLANNYGPPYGAAEVNFGRLMREDFRPYRDEMVISTKAGWDMWPGPYGQGGGSRKYVLASLDQSLERMGLDYVDVFYSHRLDASTPLEETMGALHTAVQQGKALYVGISSYDAERSRQAVEILRDLGTPPLLIHQPSYSMLNRWIEDEGLLDAAGDLGFGVIGFTALAQGLLTGRYLDGVPEDSRAAAGKSLDAGTLTDEVVGHLRAFERHRVRPRAEPRAARPRLGAARRAGDLARHRGGVPRGAARAERRGARQPVLHGRRAASHRRALVGVLDVDLWSGARSGQVS